MIISPSHSKIILSDIITALSALFITKILSHYRRGIPLEDMTISESEMTIGLIVLVISICFSYLINRPLTIIVRDGKVFKNDEELFLRVISAKKIEVQSPFVHMLKRGHYSYGDWDTLQRLAQPALK